MEFFYLFSLFRWVHFRLFFLTSVQTQVLIYTRIIAGNPEINPGINASTRIWTLVGWGYHSPSNHPITGWFTFQIAFTTLATWYNGGIFWCNSGSSRFLWVERILSKNNGEFKFLETLSVYIALFSWLEFYIFLALCVNEKLHHSNILLQFIDLPCDGSNTRWLHRKENTRWC